VRKDLAQISDGNGKPKTGYNRAKLLCDIRSFLGYDKRSRAVIVGVGHLGTALMCYKNLANYGLEITVGFDVSPQAVGTEVNGIKILDAAKLADMCKRFGIEIGIITVDEKNAQGVCDELVRGGVSGIWNFAPVTLNAPDNIVVKNEDLAASLSMLTSSMNLKQKAKTEACTIWK
jgi:redox-sensing transcriptional repressor